MFVSISTLVASERQACSCDVQPDLVGPDDPLPERQPSRLPDPLRRDQEIVAAAIEDIPVDIAKTQSGDVEPTDILDEIESITRGLAGAHPPTNPLVVLKAARWWYVHGHGGTDPAFRWAIEWAHHLTTDTPSDVVQFDEVLEYLVSVGFATEKHALR